MRVLVVNAGSSSLKLRVVDGADLVVASHDLAPDDDIPIDDLPRVDAVGHRVVHGGIEFREPVLIDDAVRRRLEALTDLAPLHQPKSLAGIDAVSAALPDVPAIACFDTAFHTTLPPAASTYALPAEWRAKWAIRRYGFHGLSHAHAARRAGAMLDRTPLRVVTCHLGAGASLAAVRDGVSIDTTMGFTPLDGLVMATRSGTIDPGLVLWLHQHAGLSVAEIEEALDRRSGLTGLAGTADMRAVLARAATGDADARLALEVYIHRLRAGVAAMAASLGGLDALVFTGGVGESSPAVRALTVAGLGFLGLAIDEVANAVARPDVDITMGDAPARVLIVAAREDLEIARHVRRLLARRIAR